MASSPPPSESLDQTLSSQSPNEDRPQSPPHSNSLHSKTLTLESPELLTLELQTAPDQNENAPVGSSAQTPRAGTDDGNLSSVASAATAATTGMSVYKRGTKRKKGGSQKKRLAQEKKSMKKLEVLNETLKPIPFAPAKNLDFSGHEKLLKRIGLWDFVHIEFDQVIRADLLAQLIANFNQGQRCSYVNGVRVMVNRADLARALQLPVKKHAAAGASEGGGEELLVTTEESIGFIEAFVSNWLLLHDDTWMTPSEVVNWMKTIKEGNLEKLDWAGMIWFMIEKELLLAPQLTDCYYASHLQYLMKSQKEELFLSRAVEEEEEEEEEEETKVEVKEYEVVAEEEDANGDVRMVGDDTDVSGHGVEEHHTELRLGQDNVVEHNVEFRHGLEEHHTELSRGQDNVVEHNVKLSIGQDDVLEKTDAKKEADAGTEELVAEKEADAGTEELVAEKEVEVGETEEGVERKEEQVVGDESAIDFQGCKEDDEHAQWFLDGKSNEGEPLLRQCSLGLQPKGLVCGDDRKQEEEDEVGQDEEEDGCEEVEEDEEEMEIEEEQNEQGGREGGLQLSPRGFPVDGLTSGGLIHSVDAAQMNLSPGMSLRDPLAGEFLSSRDDTRMSSLFGNGSSCKRDHIALVNDDSQHALNGNKRLRIDGPWDNSKPSSDFDMCMEQVQHIMGKARMMYAAKEQACETATMNQQILLNELQQRESMIDQLHRARAEEQQKRQIEVYRLERELNLMSNLLDGYRKALKENQRAFAEYRARHPQPDEPLYKDVAGSAGLVLSATEHEKQRLKQEEEERMNRLMFERKIKDFEAWWDVKFSGLDEKVTEWDNKLLPLEREMKLFKESYFAKHKVSETSEPAENVS